MNSIRSGTAVFGMLLAQFVFAQASPTARPISLVVAFPVGGGTDIVARMVADKMRVALKANVVVENKPGASAQIGTKYVTDAAADGYTLLVGTSSLINGPALFPNLPYDAARQLRPVASLADLVLTHLVNGCGMGDRIVLDGCIEESDRYPLDNYDLTLQTFGGKSPERGLVGRQLHSLRAPGPDRPVDQPEAARAPRHPGRSRRHWRAASAPP